MQQINNIRNVVYAFLITIIATVFLTACSHNIMAKHHHTNATLINSYVTNPTLPTQVHNVALLLPLSGNYAKASTAIKNGFLASYYSYNTTHADNPINVKVVDTSRKNIVDAYREVVSIGADVVVGPLIKSDVEILINNFAQGMPVPTIALNTLDNYQKKVVPNLYQFGLFPQDEAKQVADKMIQDNYKNVAVIIPSPNDWSNNLAKVFQYEFNHFDGKIIEILNYDLNNADIDLKIKDFFHANKEKTQEHDSQNININYRQDINAIFLIADGKTARKIVPFIKFYTNNALPIYTISSVYAGFIQTNLDIDLDDVRFCDMPWTIINPVNLDPSLQTLKQNLQLSIDDLQQNLSRLYALGIDSYNLAVNISAFVENRKANFVGATGELWLDDYHHVNRLLAWTNFKNGMPQGL